MKRHPVASATVARVRIDDGCAGSPSSPIQTYAIVDIHCPTTTAAAGGGGGGSGAAVVVAAAVVVVAAMVMAVAR